jgi:hypothetical protein
MVAGWKAKFLMVIVVADAPPVLAVLLELVVVVVPVVLLVVLLEVLLPPPQALSPHASPMTAAPVAATSVRRRIVRSFRSARSLRPKVSVLDHMDPASPLSSASGVGLEQGSRSPTT